VSLSEQRARGCPLRVSRNAEWREVDYSRARSLEEANMTRSTQVPLYRLPNGMSIQQANPLETSGLFRQIYVENVYFQNGISLPANPLVIDGGANIGLFTLYVLHREPTATVISVEPAPATFRLLQANTSRFPTATVHNCALGREDGTMAFTYFPNATVASGLYEAGDLERLETVARSMILKSEKTAAAFRGPQGRELLDYVLAERLKRQTVPVPVCSLSTVIANAGIGHIDLLQLDVEGKEYDTLQGVRDEHWAMIDQLVIEVHDRPVTLPLLEQLLRKHDFDVTSVSEGLLAQAQKAMIYARRGAAHSQRVAAG
jgi:FkbM family methyltransferase